MAGHARIWLDSLESTYAFCLENRHPVFLPFFLSHPPGSWINVDGKLRQVVGYRYYRADKEKGGCIFHYNTLYVVTIDGDQIPVKDHYQRL